MFQRVELSRRKGDFANALTESARGIRSSRSAQWRERFRLARAEIFLARSEVDKALQELARREQDVPPNLLARREMLEGYALLKESRFQEAQLTLDRAFGAADLAHAADVQIETQLLRALTCFAQRDLACAEGRSRDALDRATRVGDAQNQSAALLNMALFETKRSRFDAAVPILERALILAQQSDADLLRAGVLGNLSLCYMWLGDFDRAIRMRLDAIEIQRRAGTRLYVLQSLGELGNLYFQQNAPEKAISSYRQALQLAHELKSPVHIALWTRNLAEALAVREDWDEAERLNNQALDLHRQLHDVAAEDYINLNAGKIAAGRKQWSAARTRFEQVLKAATRPLLIWEAHAGLARIYSALNQSPLARKHYEAAVHTIDSTQAGLARTEYKVTFLTELIRFYQDYVAYLIGNRQDLRALEVADATRARILGERLQSGLQRRTPLSGSGLKQGAAASGGVILFYWLAPRESHLWAITPHEIRRLALPGQEDIEPLVAMHRRLLEDRLDDPVSSGSPAARKLYDILIAPAGNLIPRQANVLIIPDGVLNGLNFETLVAAVPKPHLWIEQATVSIAPSLGLLTEPAVSKTARSLLLIGDPIQATPDFPALPHAGLEIQAIRRHFASDRIEVRTREAATPAAYTNSSPNSFRMIHFTAHASANRESPLDSAVVLSSNDGHFKLYSRDVAAVPIQADIVTVSACRGAGIRAFAGEGLVGFAWAFLQAGARNVIAGLWDVSDRNTAEMMDDLYTGLAAGASPSNALRAAKLSFIRKGGNRTKPYYWAPFQVYTRVYRRTPL